MTAVTAYTGILESLRRSFRSGKTLPLSVRKECLTSLCALINENSDAICDAIYKDIRRNKTEAYCYENLFVLNEAEDALRSLDSWAAPTKVSKNFLQLLDKAYILKEPLGVVLIISPWNYPIQLLLTPLVGALAAGNCVVLKPSEYASATADLITKLFAKYFDPNVVVVVQGGVEETTELLKERFDHIFYTGSTSVGRVILQAAAKHLTPVTLELGGKCPVIVDAECDIALSGRRIAWGKFMSCGQTCLAPDYIYCHESIKNELIEEIKKTVKECYGQDPQESPDYSRIINERHFKRLLPMLQSGRVVFGGSHDKDDLYIEPTVLDNVTMRDLVMKEEIFGPILPVLTYTNINEAIEFVNDREKPLAAYIFSRNQTTIDDILRRTRSGGVTVNDVVMHVVLETLPFGGVGHSGMGRYHGKYSFDCFTHEKSVLHRPFCGEKITWMRYPPFTEAKFAWAKRLLARRPLSQTWCLLCIPLFLVAVLLAVILKAYRRNFNAKLKFNWNSAFKHWKSFVNSARNFFLA